MYNLGNPENNLSGLLGAFTKKVLPLHREKLLLTHGVIGNTADFGSVILGSSPSGSTKSLDNHLIVKAFFMVVLKLSGVCTLYEIGWLVRIACITQQDYIKRTIALA